MDDPTFEKIRDVVSRDLRAVEPLRPAWLTALVAVPLALSILIAVLLLYGIREDAPTLGFWAFWGPPALMVVVAYAVLGFAMAQRAPESTLTWPRWTGLLLVGVVVQVGGAYLTWLSAGAEGMAISWDRHAMCFTRISALSVPALAAVLWLLTRGLPFRPRIAGLSAGLGVGFVAEGVYRLQCGLSAEHVVVWHTGAVIFAAVVGLFFGLGWEQVRFERWLGERTSLTE